MLKVERNFSRLGAALVAEEDIPAGAAVFEFFGALASTPTRYSIQRDHEQHWALDGLWISLNHACEPNCRVDFDLWTLQAVRPIRAGEQLTYNYLSTEWEMAAPFSCGCGSPRCFGTIQGFRHLTDAQQRLMLPEVSPYLRRRYDELSLVRRSAGQPQGHGLSSPASIVATRTG